MKKTLLSLVVILFAFALNAQQQIDSIRIKTTGTDGGVEISTDDVEQLNNQIDKLFDDDLDMGWEGDEFNVLITGLRFRDLMVPKNAVIDSAFLVMHAHEDEGDLSKITIYAEASDNAITYNDVDLISSRPKTTAFVKWDVSESWTIWNKYQSPNIGPLVQEVVNRAGWAPGNALAIMVNGEDQGASTEDNARDFEAFENIADPDDGGDGLNHPERIPQLLIYYHVLSGTHDMKTLSHLEISPNPVSGKVIQVAVDEFLGENIVATLHDETGKTIQSWNFDRIAQSNVVLNVNAAAGTYILNVSSATRQASAKVVVK